MVLPLSATGRSHLGNLGLEVLNHLPEHYRPGELGTVNEVLGNIKANGPGSDGADLRAHVPRSGSIGTDGLPSFGHGSLIGSLRIGKSHARR